MTLIKSISGIRGTIGGSAGDGLSPLDIVKFASAYATFIRRTSKSDSNRIVVGRDARISGSMVYSCVAGALTGMGFDVVNIGLATTPTTEMAVVWEKACGGIIITASHNPKQWNALKLLNENGEFLSAADGREVLDIAAREDFEYAGVDGIGREIVSDDYTGRHIKAVLDLPLVDVKAIREAGFTVAVDCVNSVGGIAVPRLLDALWVKRVEKLYCTPDGNFPHNPEPLPQHLTAISDFIRKGGVDVGFVVDPDVDRLAIVCENGDMFGEEYTLVACADYVLRYTPGSTVSNLSSSRALGDVTRSYGEKYYSAAVGEVNVVARMKEVDAVIGGEGNGGVIYPALHYGRDALAGIALFLTYLAKSRKKVSELRDSYPQYFMAKKRMELDPAMDTDRIFAEVKARYSEYPISDIDGIKIDFPDCWVQLRKSNTEPIVRIYSEAKTMKAAEAIADEVIDIIKSV